MNKNETVFTYKMLTYVDVLSLAHYSIFPKLQNHLNRTNTLCHSLKTMYELVHMRYTEHLLQATSQVDAVSKSIKTNKNRLLTKHMICKLRWIALNMFKLLALPQCHQVPVHHLLCFQMNIMSLYPISFSSFWMQPYENVWNLAKTTIAMDHTSK